MRAAVSARVAVDGLSVRVAAAEDAGRAKAAAAAVRSRWETARTRAIEGGDIDEVRALEVADSALDAALERVAVTEAAEAFNAQLGAWADAARAAGRRVIETWVSALELNTCDECYGLHGEQRESPDYFASRPPLHPRCACVIDLEIE